MAIVTGDQYLESLVKFVENQAERLIEGTLILKLNPVGLRYVQSRLEALAELESLIAGAPVDYLRAYVSDLGDHRALEQLRRILRLLPSLKVVSVLPLPGRDPTPLYLLPFGRLKVLELRGCDLSTSAAKGLLELRFTLEKLICHNSTDALRHVFASRIAEIKDSPQWNRLSFVSCACNCLVLMDESLQLLPVVETLDLSRNKFTKVDNLRKCTKLKHLDLGFNNLRSIASLCKVPCQIVELDLRNNALSTLHGLESLKSLVGLDLSYNIISNFAEMEILAGLPSLQNLWLEGNPLCCARWFRAQIFSLFSHPEKLKLDEKRISPSEFWKMQIIVASRLKQPASFGFYVPAKDDADLGGISTKRKSTTRVVSIENEDQSIHICSDQDSVSCDNEIQSKDENAIADNQTEIEHLMKRIEFMKKEHSVLWLQEFKEWMDKKSGNVDGSKLRNIILSNNKEIHNDGEIKDEDLGETSRYVSDSIQHSGDESSTVILESETSFADTSTVVSAQRYFDRINDTASKFWMGHVLGDRSVVVNNLSMNQEEPRFLNDEVRVSADAGDSSFNLLAVTRSDDMNNKKLIPPSIAINNILGSRSSSACPGSPPHYQEDILHRRQNLEEEFLQLSAESFSLASSDSNTSCSEDDSAEVAPKITQVYQSFVHNISGRSENDCFISSDRGNDYVKNSALKQNGTPMSSPLTKGNFISNEGIELEVSTHACSGSINDAMHDYEIEDFLKVEPDWLEKKKRRRKPRRLISLPEDDGTLDDTDSSKKSNDYFEICRSDMGSEGKECCMSDLSKAIPARSNGGGATPNVLKYNRRPCSGLNTLSGGTDDFIETYFNSNLANSGVNEISMERMQCNCLFPGKSGYYERDVAVVRSSKHKLYIFLIVNECDGSGTGLEIMGCHRIGDVREVFVGLGVQVVRVHFEGNATYLFITRCMERSRELLGVLDFLDSSRKECCSLISLEHVQINLFEKNICGGSKINIFQYSMVLFWQNNLEENLWLSRSLFVLGGHLILCTEDLLQFGPTQNAFFPHYFSLDSYCAIASLSEMVIDSTDNLCVTLALECTSNIPLSKEAYRIEEAICLNKNPVSHPSIWKLKWFSKEGLFNCVALLKAIHGRTTSSPLIVRYKS